MGVFADFTTSDYTFLQLANGIAGNTVVAEYAANGIVKLRDTKAGLDRVETPTSRSTVHIRPDETFFTDLGRNVIGHGMRITKDANGPFEYRIVEQVEGYDFDTGTLEFVKVVLQREDIAT
jgi:hypothetical protein